jgi:hypothetical protein
MNLIDRRYKGKTEVSVYFHSLCFENFVPSDINEAVDEWSLFNLKSLTDKHVTLSKLKEKETLSSLFGSDCATLVVREVQRPCWRE